MKEFCLATILPRRQRTRGEEALLVERYLERARRLAACSAAVFETEDALFRSLERAPGRPAAVAVLFDGRGANLASGEFAQLLGRLQDGGAQRIVLAVGPADGWTDAARKRAAALVAFGRITLPHELAQAVAAEQLYRALTILAGHPYHSGH